MSPLDEASRRLGGAVEQTMRRICSCFLLVATFAGTADAIEIQAGSIDGSHRIEVLSGDPEHTRIRFDVGSFAMRQIPIDGGEFAAIEWEGGVVPVERGRPMLPGFRESIVIPDAAEMAIQVVSSEYRDFPGVRIAPSKGPITRDIDPNTVPWEFGAAYTRNAFFPAEIASIGEPFILRDVRGLVVAVDPFQWNPVTGTLRVYTSVTVQVDAVGTGGRNALRSRPERPVAEFQKIHANHFLNWGSSARYNAVAEVGSMLVIAHDAFAAAAQPLVDWKNQMGVPTTIVPMSQVGTTATHLKAYVQNVFNSTGLCFILLVGDGAQIPYFVNDGGAADPMLTLLAGSDSYPDAFVGRISAENVAQVQTQVQRIVEYERDPNPAGAWYSKGIAIASNEGDGYGDEGQADWEHAQIYRAQLLGFTYTLVNELYDGNHPSEGGIGGGGGVDQAGNPTAAMVSNALNAGRGVVHYTGHGSTFDWVTTGFGNGDVNALTNHNMLPCVVSVGCVNGAFMSTTCFAEAWMRATNAGEPTGAISCYASTVNQQWATPMEAQDEMIALLCGEVKQTFGGTCFNGSCSMIEDYGSLGITEFKNWTLFGDPSLQMRTATPAALTVNHGGFVDGSSGTFDVWTDEGAMVALSFGPALLGSAIADGAGHAVVEFDPQSAASLETATLTVTGFNRIPSVEAVEVQSGPTGVAGRLDGIRIDQNQPNPFERSTGISLALDRGETVRLEIFDVAGRKIRTLHDGAMAAGPHRFVWDGANDAGRAAAAGTYFYRLATPAGVETRRMVRLR